MALDDWRKLSPREAASVCTPDPSSSRTVLCSTEDLPLGASYAARNLSYRFKDGKLVEISFQTSVDGFDHATAVLKKRFGEPTDIVRDTVRLQNGMVFPHVLMRWRNGRSTIALSDPAAKGVMLSVRFTLNSAPDPASKLE